jgi:hypothetical protein
VGFLVDKMALGHVLSEYFGFPANLHATNFFTIPSPIIRGWYNRPVSGRRTQNPTAQIKKKRANVTAGI